MLSWRDRCSSVLNSSEWPPQLYKAFSNGASACLPLLAIMDPHRLALVAPCSFTTFKSQVIVYAIRVVQQLNLTARAAAQGLWLRRQQWWKQRGCFLSWFVYSDSNRTSRCLCIYMIKKHRNMTHFCKLYLSCLTEKEEIKWVTNQNSEAGFVAEFLTYRSSGVTPSAGVQDSVGISSFVGMVAAAEISSSIRTTTTTISSSVGVVAL